MNYTIHPHQGINDVRFGSPTVEVERLIGPADRVRTTGLREREEVRGDSYWRYSAEDNVLVEVSFGRLSHLLIHGIDVFADSTSLSRLLALEMTPLESHGFILLNSLGLAITGLHDGDRDQASVTAFIPGRWDKVIVQARPFA
jgi:hypothetical protein